MIATQTLPSPSRGAILPASATAAADPAALAGGPGAGSAGVGSAAPAAFGTLLARSTAPVFATIPSQTPSSDAAAAASPSPSALAADPLLADLALPKFAGAGLTQPVATSPIAFFTALVPALVPGQIATATGNALPPTGKRLPLSGSAGPIPLAIALSSTATETTPEAAPTDDTTPTDPAAPIPLTPLVPPTLPVIDLVAAVVAAPPELAATPVQASPTDIGPAAAPALPANAPAASGPIGKAQPSDGAAARFSPLAASQLTAAPLVRLAADAALPQSAVATKVALPAAAAVADTPAVPLASPSQPATPARARALTDAAAPADRREAQAGEPLPNATDITPAPPAAPLIPPAPTVHADPLVPAAAASAAPADRIDFATLVDTIAQAREHAAPQTASAPVSVSLAHADFGPVALRFRHDGDALAVTMASADPGFAPAVSAASQADAGARPGQQQTDSQPRQHQPGSGQPTSGQPQSSGSASGSAGQGASDHRQQGQTRSSAPTQATRAAARATDAGSSDPDIFA